MKRVFRSLIAAVSLSVCATSVVSAQEEFSVPLRINMGGPELVDSFGRTWLGDGPGTGDPLGIRPNDIGGQNSVVDWCGPDFNSDESLELLGFDPFNANDVSIFSTIRWDETTLDDIQFDIQLPLPDGEYWVNLYFRECGAGERHFSITLEGEVVWDDVSYRSYDIVDPGAPLQGRVGRLSAPVTVADGVLDLSLLPCPECEFQNDTNPIIDAIEVLSGEDCGHEGLDLNCTFDSEAGGVNVTWSGLAGADSYRILRDGKELTTLPGTARDYVDAGVSGAVSYTLEALDGDAAFASCRCSTNAFACASDLVCDTLGTEVHISWSPAGGLDVESYEIRRDGELIATLPATASEFEDEPEIRSVTYTVTPVTNPPDQCTVLSCDVTVRDAPFALPLRINMGGEAMVDSLGREWLGDRPCNAPATADPLGIRRDVGGGANAVCNWAACPTGADAESLAKLGFDGGSDADRHILNTIRWDLGNDGIDFYLDLPVENRDDYIVNLYFNECCCVGRHFQVSLQDEIVDDQVSYLSYDPVPALAKVGVLSFANVVVDAGRLSIGFLPCADLACVDPNAIINAIEIIPGCEDAASVCPGSLVCSTEGNQVTGTWSRGACIDIEGWEVLRDGETLETLPSNAAEFTDTLTSRTATYSILPILADGEPECPAFSCEAINTDLPFAVPLRLNMGGPTLVDSLGRIWTGDGSGPADQLDIRLDDAGGSNSILNWCNATAQSNADSLQAFGLDPFDAADLAIFNTIRWDLGDDDADGSAGEIADGDGGDIDFLLELPIPDGDYLVSFYFTECTSAGRFFQIELEENLVEEEVNLAEYSRSGRFGRTGRLSYDDISVEDGMLSIALRPCFLDCFDATDFNAIVDAIEVLPSGTELSICPRDLVVTEAGGTFFGEWSPGENVDVSGYTVYRNGVEIMTLGADALDFEDVPPCERRLVYEVVPESDDADFLCPDLRMTAAVARPECPFEVPLRINMGGDETVDSLGRLWLGDRPCAAAPTIDPLGIRPDLLGGANAICNWNVVGCAGGPDAESIAKIGLDPDHPGDNHIFSTIRWDTGIDGIDDYRVELAVPDGEYDLNLYFNECCCIDRHFKIEVQGEIVLGDTSYLNYDDEPALGKVGQLSFPGIEVDTGVLVIGFLPCLECEGAVDTNAIVNAIEVLPTGPLEICDNEVDDDDDGDIDCDDSNCANFPACRVDPGELFVRGDVDASGSINLTDGVNILLWSFQGGTAPVCLDAADTDDSGAINLSDPIRIFQWLFLGGEAPVDPTPSVASYSREDCGVDPTVGDPFDCGTVPATCQ